MRVAIVNDQIWFISAKEWSGCELIKRGRIDNKRETIQSKELAYESGICTPDEVVVASLPLLDFNALEYSLIVHKDGREQDYDEALSKFRLDPAQMDSHYYVTVHFFGAGMKRLEGDNLLYQVLCYLQTMPVSWQFYGGLITLAVFRISEKLERRANLVDFLLQRHEEMLNVYRPVSDHSVRWLISSSYNLAVICLYLGRLGDAEKLLDTSIQHGALNRSFPLTYMNYAQSLLLSGVIKFEVGKKGEAAHLFTECSDFCSYALSELFNLRNKFLLQHEMDSRVILDAGYAAFKAAVLLADQRFASDSKLADFKVERERVDKVDFSVIVRRYERQMGKVPHMLIDAAAKLK